MVTCSGIQADGSLRIVRNGIGMIEQATAELPGIKGVWALRGSSADAHDSRLVLTFVGETRVLVINASDELEEDELAGFDADAQTLFCGNVAGDQVVQVTRGGVRLAGAGGRGLLAEWRPPPGLQVTVASASATQVVVAAGEGHLVCLEVGDAALREAGHVALGAEVACLSAAPLEEGAAAAALVAVGTWDRNVHMLALPSLAAACPAEALGGDVIPRSVLLAALEGVPYLLCALGDGQLLNFRIDPASGALSERKKLALGTKPAELRAFRSSGASHVFAASDRPTIIYSSNKKLLYSNLNENEVRALHVATWLGEGRGSCTLAVPHARVSHAWVGFHGWLSSAAVRMCRQGRPNGNR